MGEVETERSLKKFFSKADQGNGVAAGQGREVCQEKLFYLKRREIAC